MARTLEHYEKERMKMAMLKQEEMFRQQVHELHRLYRLQKMLMTDVTKACTLLNVETDHERSSPENETGSSKSCDSSSEHRKTPVLEESDLELTLAIGSAPKKRTKKETLSSSDSRASSSTASGGPTSNGDGCSLSQPSELASGILSTEFGRLLDQEGLEQPPWLQQCLNLSLQGSSSVDLDLLRY